jgi:ABC-type uncharacterized transport system
MAPLFVCSMRHTSTAIFLSLLAAGCEPAAQPIVQRDIAIVSALPLFWAEGQFGAAVKGIDPRAPIIQKLSEQSAVRPLDTISAKTVEDVTLLILAQPRSLAPSELIDLDDWVRRGGKLLIFADPMLDWPSLYPMGDPRRPPLVTLLDPLLDHWGLDLSAPEIEQGREVIEVDGKRLAMVGAGHWVVTKERNAGVSCKTSVRDFLASCTIGQGRVLLLGDADALDARVWNEASVDNVSAIVALLDRLEAIDAK